MTVACVAKRAGKLIDQRFLRSLNTRERTKMEDHLVACSHCRERYRRLHVAERVACAGPDGDLDGPSPFEIDRIAQDLGLMTPPKRSLRFLDVRLFGGAAASVALAVALAGVFMQPAPEQQQEWLVGRGLESPPIITFSTFAISEARDVRQLGAGAAVKPTDHLKLRASWLGETRDIRGVDVILVGADGKIEHAQLVAPDAQAHTSVPGAVALDGFAPGDLTAYVVAAPSFSMARVRHLAARRAPPREIARALGEGAVVERVDLEMGVR